MQDPQREKAFELYAERVFVMTYYYPLLRIIDLVKIVIMMY